MNVSITWTERPIVGVRCNKIVPYPGHPELELEANTFKIQYAAVMGIIQELELFGNKFSNLATFLFVGFLCFEVVNGT